MSSTRPDPDEVLREVEEEARRRGRGRLTIYFGAAPGVGKTYAMLEAARAEARAGRDVVLGVVETHGREETAALLEGLTSVPLRALRYRGVELHELDVDAVLARRPALVVIDELAHTNAEGSRHTKRWQDVEELLEAGIDVFTALNVQHVESLNDVVAQVTGVVVRETVPDAVLERADDVRLVDLPPDELLQRLREGKVYVPEQAARAGGNFFRKGNLIALRELSLRRTAERVDAQMRSYKKAHGIARTWPVRERVLVCVSPSPESARLLRSARRLATELHAEVVAVYVETAAALRMSEASRRRVLQNLRLAEELGAETVTLSAEHAAEETLRYARARNATKIVVGRPTHPRWRDLLRESFLEEIVRGSDGIDVYVISGEGATTTGAPAPRATTGLAGYAWSAAAVLAATSLSGALFGRSQLPDVVMVYLLAIVIVALRLGRGPSLAAVLGSVVTYDIFFVPPYYSIAVSDLRHVVTFAVMFLVAVVISRLTQRVRDQADVARARERRATSLYAVARELATEATEEAVLRVGASHVGDVFDAGVAVLLPREGGRLQEVFRGARAFSPDSRDLGVAAWVLAHGRAAGRGTDTLPGASALYLPLRSGVTDVGVLGVRTRVPDLLSDPDQRRLLETIAGQLAGALARTELADQAQRAALETATERMRSSLLSSVSHDLRTPLGVVTGAASTLLSREVRLTEADREELLSTIHEEALRLSRLVHNLLEMTRVASGALRVRRDWQPLDALLGAALERLEGRLVDRVIDARFPRDLPLVAVDGVLVEQVLINLIENALKYAPPSEPIEVEASPIAGGVRVEVRDRGPGIPSVERERVFETFYRLPREGAGSGAGLGLAICRGIVAAHGGHIEALPRDGGGTIFRFDLPIVGTPPQLGTGDAEASA